MSNTKREIAKIAREIKSIKRALLEEDSWQSKPWWNIFLDTYARGSKVSKEEAAYAKKIAKYIDKKVSELRKHTINMSSQWAFKDAGPDDGNNFVFVRTGVVAPEFNYMGFNFFSYGEPSPVIVEQNGSPRGFVDYKNPKDFVKDIDWATNLIQKRFESEYKNIRRRR